MSDYELTGFEWQSKTEVYVDAYAELDTRYHGIYSKSAARLCQLANLKSGDTVIELGCGTGTSTAAFWEQISPDGRIIAVDVSPKMIERAKLRFSSEPNVLFVVEDAFGIAKVCASMGLSGQVDSVVSSFTYYYMYDGREQLQRDIFQVLQEGGTWAFNITSYLGPIEHNGQTYNQFSGVYFGTLDQLLRERGFRQGLGKTSKRKEQLRASQWDVSLLHEIGFSNVCSEVWPLPVSAMEAFKFTIEGFYQFGSRTTFSKTLMTIELPQRIELMMEALERCSAALHEFGQTPHIINVVATK